MIIGGTNGLTLVIYHADPASADEDKLALLAAADLPPVAPDREATHFSRRQARSHSAEPAAEPCVR